MDLRNDFIAGLLNAKGWSCIPQRSEDVHTNRWTVDHYNPETPGLFPIFSENYIDTGKEVNGNSEWDVVKEMDAEDERRIYGDKHADSVKEMRKKYCWDDPKVRAFYGE